MTGERITSVKRMPQRRFLSQTFAEVELRRSQNRNNPRLDGSKAVAFVTLSTILLTYAGIFGFVPILMFYVMWLPKTVYKGQFILRPTKDLRLLALFAGVCLISVAWSDYPSISLKAAFEFISMLLCTIIISRIVTIESFIIGLALGSCLALIPLFITGAYFEGGLFGSKNQVGYSAEIGFYATLISFFITRSYLRRFVYLLCLALCAVCLVLSSSATSVLSLATTIGITCVALCLSKTPRGLRALLLIFSCIVGTMFLWFALSSGMEQSLFSALGKDSTLTGRTYLWSEGIKAAMVKPILGYGYHAFWVQGRSLAERYWYELDIPGRSGFHFHNTFIQIFVDLGVLGLITFSLLVFATCFKSIRYVLRNDADLLGIFSLGISFMLFIRAFTEVDIGGPFSLGPLLFYSIIPRLAMYQTLQAKQTI